MLLFGTLWVHAQTNVFTYQGSLKDGANPANGNYDFDVKLFDAVSGGNQVAAQGTLNVPVSNGTFAFNLGFGASFTGAARWLEISVKPAGSPNPYTLLTPRQQVWSTPYAIRSLNAATSDNATQLGGVAANQYVTTTTGNTNYIQNTSSQQPASSFHVSGVGIANIFSAVTHYDLGGARILFGNQNSTFTGKGAGTNNTGGGNSFFGALAGNANSTGFNNSFFGNLAGQFNTIGNDNAFFGIVAGNKNTEGARNSFFGGGAGFSNTTANDNSFFGNGAGFSNTTGTNNSFFGSGAGGNNGLGGSNSFFGYRSGAATGGGSSNSFFGTRAGEANVGGLNSFFGVSTGASNVGGSSNSFFGSLAGFGNTSGIENTFVGRDAGAFNIDGNNNTALGQGANFGAGNLMYATAIGSDAIVAASNTVQLGRADGSDVVLVPGRLEIGTLGTAGATSLCLNGSNRVAPCSSSLRYKTNLTPFRAGLEIARRLQPITFDWKDGGKHDLGLGAEDVAKIEPLLVTYNKEGQIEGVKYDRVGVVLLNAVKEQQTQIESQQKTIEAQQKQIDALTKLVCVANSSADICKEK